MSNVTLLLNQYKTKFTQIQAIGLMSYKNYMPDATLAFKYARDLLAQQYSQLLLEVCEHESNYFKRLYLIQEICETLSSTPVQAGSKANVLVTFSYSFLRSLNDGIWGFPNHVADLVYQQECSDKIIYAVCGKQLLETTAAAIQPNEDVVCVALEYLFICQNQGIVLSEKHANAKKSIDVHFKFNPDILLSVLNSLFSRLSGDQQKEKFLMLIDGVIAQFSNNNIRQVLLNFKHNKMSANYLGVCDFNPANVFVDQLVAVLSDTAESFDGSETEVPAKANAAFGLEEDEKSKLAENKKNPHEDIVIWPKINDKTDEIVTGVITDNPYGAIGTPRKKSEAPTLINPAIVVSTSSSTVKSSLDKPKFDLSKIIWGVLPNLQKSEQINEFKRFIKTLKNSEESVRLAIQFLLLISNNDQDLLCPTYRDKAVELIALGLEHIDTALNTIYLALTSQEDKAAFIKALTIISANFNIAKYTEVKNRLVGFNPAVSEGATPKPIVTPLEVKDQENKIIWGVPSDDKIREQQIEYFKTNIFNINDKAIDAATAIQFVILLKKGAQTIYAPEHWALVISAIVTQSADAISKAIYFIQDQLTTQDDKINFIRVLSKVAFSFNAYKYLHFRKIFTSHCEDLQIAVKTLDENINLLMKLDLINEPALKVLRDELFAKNQILSGLINKSVSSNTHCPDSQELYNQIKKIKECILLNLGKLDSENNINMQSKLHVDRWSLRGNSVNNHHYTQRALKVMKK